MNILNGFFKTLSHVKNLETVILYKWLLTMLKIPKTRNESNKRLSFEDLEELPREIQKEEK